MKIKRRDFLKGAAGSMALLALDGKDVQARTVQALPPEAVGILFDSTLCVGCNACMTACKEANNMQPDFAEGQDIYDQPVDL
ncbi:MAG TPA: hydrogenase 2 protein HybA, partial [Desulfocapsa sulfexigens]|nr:hydrogenase 2 protein HybA [Desulfocapsa sulfexigens]